MFEMYNIIMRVQLELSNISKKKTHLEFNLKSNIFRSYSSLLYLTLIKFSKNFNENFLLSLLKLDPAIKGSNKSKFFR